MKLPSVPRVRLHVGLARAVVNRALSDIMMCPVRPQRRGDDYRGVTLASWNHAILLIFSEELEWKSARRFWLGIGGMDELSVQMEGLAHWAYHNTHGHACPLTSSRGGS